MDSINLNDIFLDDNYSIDSVFRSFYKLHGKLNLSDIREKLLQHQQDLNQSSLDLFNNSYDKFYKLSYIIACLAEPVQHLIDPLQSFKDQLSSICQNHNAYVDEISKKLALLEETSKNKELAKKLVELIKRRDRLEKQIGLIDWSYRPIDHSEKSDNIEHKIKCDLIERVNTELFILISEAHAIQPTHDELIPIKRSLELSLETRRCQLNRWLSGDSMETTQTKEITPTREVEMKTCPEPPPKATRIENNNQVAQPASFADICQSAFRTLFF